MAEAVAAEAVAAAEAAAQKAATKAAKKAAKRARQREAKAAASGDSMNGTSYGGTSSTDVAPPSDVSDEYPGSDSKAIMTSAHRVTHHWMVQLVPTVHSETQRWI